jgi:hypothetical protein
MGEDEKRAAIAAIQGMIIQARLLAYGKAPHVQIAELLDQCEYLPGLLLEKGDHSVEFTQALRDLSMRVPSCRYVFDQYEAAIKGD